MKDKIKKTKLPKSNLTHIKFIPSEKDCLDCQHCYIEDIWHEICCNINGYIGEETNETAKYCKDYKKNK